MSETVTEPVPPVPPVVVAPVRSQPESLWSQSFIYGMTMLPIAAGVIVCAFFFLDKQVSATIAAMSLPLLLNPSPFYFGGVKDRTPTGTTQTTTAGPPATTTTETRT